MAEHSEDTTWRRYAADFNAMTDAEIESECNFERSLLDEAESWLEAVAAWEAAGKPRAALASAQASS